MEGSMLICLQHSLRGITSKKKSISGMFIKVHLEMIRFTWATGHLIKQVKLSIILVSPLMEYTSEFSTFSDSRDDIGEGKYHFRLFRSSFVNNWICTRCSSFDKTSGQIDLWQLINPPMEYTSAFSTFSSGDDKGKEKSSQIRFHLTFYLSSCN